MALRIARKLMKVGEFSDSVSLATLNYRPPLYHPDFPVIIMWSQKAACTIAVKWFFHHLGLLDEALGHHRWIHNYENDVFKTRPGYMEECLKAIEGGKPVIKLVRDPYERAFSGYLETCNRRVLNAPDHWSAQVRSAVLKHLTGREQSLEYTYSFVQFCYWLGRQDAGELDPHLAPQFQGLERNLNVEHVKIDESGNPFLRLEKRLGLKSSEGQKLVHHSPHHHRKEAMPVEDAVRMLHLGIAVLRDRAFNVYDAPSAAIRKTSAASQLAALYQEDFAAYGYNT